MESLDRVKLDSYEGIEHFIRWARAHNVVINEGHVSLAKKYNVSIENLIVNRKLPYE